jgi:predicted NUDIX family phosphoesterase
MTRHFITDNLNKGKPQFILAVDAAYYRTERVVTSGKTEDAFGRPINHFPHDLFLAGAQSYLTIREREYLDESTSYTIESVTDARTEVKMIKNAKGENKKGDPRYKQLLPYMIARQLQDDGTYLYFPYRRTQKVGESRLAGNGSLGYGGHIDLEDVVSTKSVIDLQETILKSALREAMEEFTLLDRGGFKITDPVHYQLCIGFGDLFIVDDSNDVGELHLGIVMHFDVPQGWHLEASEDELAKLPPMTAEQMLDSADFNPENWTRFYLDHVAKPKILSIDHGGVKVGEADVETVVQALNIGELVPPPSAEHQAALETSLDALSAQAPVSEEAALGSAIDVNTLIGKGDTIPAGVSTIPADWTNNVDWNNAIQGSPVNAVELKVDEVQAGLAVTNAVSLSAEVDKVE